VIKLKTTKNIEMKKIIKTLVIVTLFITTPLLLDAQSPPHPNGGGGPGGGNTPVGGGAPIDGGLSIMLLLGAAYGSRKIYQIKK
jgi:hypothetical protein